MTAVPLPGITLTTGIPKDADVVVVGIADASSAPVLIGVSEAADRAFTKQFGRGLRDLALSFGARTRRS